MRFIIFGVGAIGTYIGASLLEAAQEVTFIERPEIARQASLKRVSLHLPGGKTISREADVVTSLSAAIEKTPADAAIVAVKAFDTDRLAKTLKPHERKIPALVCMQNGVDNEKIYADVLSRERVIPATLTSAVGRRGAGDVVLEKLRGIGLARGHVLVPEISRIFNLAGLNSHIYPNASSMKWSKLLTNVQSNALPAILQLSPAQVFSNPLLFNLEIRQLREALAVMQALKLSVVDLPGTPVRLLAFLAKTVPEWLGRPLAQRFLAGGRGGKMPSLYIDLVEGRKQTEADYLYGAVVRYGEGYGIPTPVNRMVNQTLQKITSGEIKQDRFKQNPEKLLDELDHYIVSQQSN